MWQLVLCDWDITVAIHQVGGLALVDVAEPITFEIPGGLTLPLRIVSLQVSKWNEDMTALIVLYEIQSFRPYLWDWDLNDWSEEPDPSYREVFIPELGNYYYYVDVEELVVAPVTQDWLTIIGPILVIGLMAGLLLPMMKGMFKK